MITFKQLRLDGFRSFKKPVIFVLDRSSGLRLLQGEMGAGKSSVFEGVTWVLTGKTTRGLRGKHVASWDGSGYCSGSLWIERDGKSSIITRTYDPITLTIDSGDGPAIVEQKEIDALLGADASILLNTCIFGQFAQYFLDLSSTEKLAIFSGVLGLGVWDAAADTAREEELAAQKELEAAKLDARFLSGKLEADGLALDAAKQQSREFIERERDEEEAGKARLYAAKQAATAAKEKLLQATLKLAGFDKKVKALTTKIERAAREVADRQEIVSGTREELAGARQQYNTTLGQLKQLAGLGNECPTCFSRVDARHTLEVEQRFQAAKARHAAKISGLERTIEGQNTEVRSAEAIVASFRDEMKALEHAANKTRVAELRDAQLAEARATAEVEAAEKALTSTKQKQNPFTKQIAALTKSIENNKEALQEAQAKTDILESAIVDYAFWKKTFREIRLWVVDQALIELELYVNNAIVELGLPGWRVKFDIERASADGKSVVKGFTTFVIPPDHDSETPLPWESWSGGETQRLRLAGALGLATLIAERTGFKTNIEVFDEPTAHMSATGINQLVEILAERARLEDRCVWLIDHRALHSASFTETLTVVKTDSGSDIHEA